VKSCRIGLRARFCAGGPAVWFDRGGVAGGLTRRRLLAVAAAGPASHRSSRSRLRRCCTVAPAASAARAGSPSGGEAGGLHDDRDRRAAGLSPDHGVLAAAPGDRPQPRQTRPRRLRRLSFIQPNLMPIPVRTGSWCGGNSSSHLVYAQPWAGTHENCTRVARMAGPSRARMVVSPGSAQSERVLASANRAANAWVILLFRPSGFAAGDACCNCVKRQDQWRRTLHEI